MRQDMAFAYAEIFNMATSNYIDITNKLNADQEVVLDIGGAYGGTITFANAGENILFSTTNDGGEVEGSLLSSHLTAINFTACELLDLSTNTLQPDTASATDVNMKFLKLGKYLKIEFSDTALVDKAIVQLYKII